MVALSNLLLLVWAAPLASFTPLRKASSRLRLRATEDGEDVESFRKKLLSSQESDVESFRSKLLAGAMEFDRVTEAQHQPEEDEFVLPSKKPEAGGLLIANPAAFFAEPEFRARYGVGPITPEDLPPDRIAELLPVVMVHSHSSLQSGGFVLNRRTGLLMGDLAEEHGLRCFQVQPIWYGGPFAEGQLSMVHTYPQVEDARKIADGLYLGGSFDSAQDEVTNGIASGWNFKFFLQMSAWGAGSLEDEIRRDWWLPATCSPQVVMKIRERGGGNLRPKPMWREVLELAGGDYDQVQKDFYQEL